MGSRGLIDTRDSGQADPVNSRTKIDLKASRDLDGSRGLQEHVNLLIDSGASRARMAREAHSTLIQL